MDFGEAIRRFAQTNPEEVEPAPGQEKKGVRPKPKPKSDDLESGAIYVLRSLSEHPVVAERRDLIHKIGVTGGDVGARVANARHDPTYLLADVEIVATYRLYNINRAKLEAEFHRVFGRARLDLMIPARFGQAVRPREWFLVPLHVIDEVVKRITNQMITDYEYDPANVSLVQHADGVGQSWGSSGIARRRPRSRIALRDGLGSLAFKASSSFASSRVSGRSCSPRILRIARATSAATASSSSSKGGRLTRVLGLATASGSSLARAD